MRHYPHYTDQEDGAKENQGSDLPKATGLEHDSVGNAAPKSYYFFPTTPLATGTC